MVPGSRPSSRAAGPFTARRATSMVRWPGVRPSCSAHALNDTRFSNGPELLDRVVNLMLTQRTDGSVILGDTHHYDRTHQPFDDEGVAELLLREGARLLGAKLTVRRRWRGLYAESPVTDFLIAQPHPGTRVVLVTTGIGMTTALGIAPTVLDELF
jgi:glycine/D-amino acid oxidase-like deaminating enzyme